jgi:hypothetical protein
MILHCLFLTLLGLYLVVRLFTVKATILVVKDRRDARRIMDLETRRWAQEYTKNGPFAMFYPLDATPTHSREETIESNGPTNASIPEALNEPVATLDTPPSIPVALNNPLNDEPTRTSPPEQFEMVTIQDSPSDCEPQQETKTETSWFW